MLMLMLITPIPLRTRVFPILFDECFASRQKHFLPIAGEGCYMTSTIFRNFGTIRSRLLFVVLCSSWWTISRTAGCFCRRCCASSPLPSSRTLAACTLALWFLLLTPSRFVRADLSYDQRAIEFSGDEQVLTSMHGRGSVVRRPL